MNGSDSQTTVWKPRVSRHPVKLFSQTNTRTIPSRPELITPLNVVTLNCKKKGHHLIEPLILY